MSFADLESGSGYRAAEARLAEGSDVKYMKAHRRLTEGVRQYGQFVHSVSRLAKQLGTDKDTTELRGRLHEQVEQARRLARRLTRELKAFGDFQRDVPSGRERDTRRAQQRKLAKDFEQQMSEFERVVTRAAKKEEEYVAKARKPGSSGRRGGAGGGWGDDDADPREEEQRRLIEAKLEADMSFTEDMIAEREESIEQIHRSVVEVNEIFRDLAAIVDEQKADVGTIESELESSRNAAKAAYEETEKASKLQMGARSKCLTLLFIIGIIIAAAVLYVLFGMKGAHGKK